MPSTTDMNKMLKIADRAVRMARVVVAMADELGMDAPKKRRKRVRTEAPKPTMPRKRGKAGPALAQEES